MITLTTPLRQNLKLAQGDLTLKRSFGKNRLLLDSFDEVGGWASEFDTDQIETLDTSIKKEGTSSLQTLHLLSGRESTTLNDCDSVANITQNTAATFTLNNTTFKEGTGAINIIKSVTATNSGFTFDFSSQNFSDATHKLDIWVYIKDQTTLDKISHFVMFVSDGVGFNKWNSSDDIQLQAPVIGWNFYRVTPTSPEGTEGGGSDTSAITSFRIRMYTNADTDTWVEGDVIVDFLHRRSQAGYGSFVNRTFNQDWTGHSLTDRLSFWIYIPDISRFLGDVELSFGDTVAGGVQAKASYVFSASRLQAGWNYISAELSEFTLDAGYTIDFSNIAQFRITTTYATSTTNNTEVYDPSVTLDINIDYMELEQNNYIEVKQ